MSEKKLRIEFFPIQHAGGDVHPPKPRVIEVDDWTVTAGEDGAPLSVMAFRDGGRTGAYAGVRTVQLVAQKQARAA